MRTALVFLALLGLSLASPAILKTAHRRRHSSGGEVLDPTRPQQGPWLQRLKASRGGAAPKTRVKRFTDRDCTMNPDNDAENVVLEGDTVLLQCNFDDTVSACTFTHKFPLTDKGQVRRYYNTTMKHVV